MRRSVISFASAATGVSSPAVMTSWVLTSTTFARSGAEEAARRAIAIGRAAEQVGLAYDTDHAAGAIHHRHGIVDIQPAA